MGIFTGKRALCFLALPHHNRFLVPIMEALQNRGMETIYFTVPAEGAFEITLNQAQLPYRHVLDYVDRSVQEKSQAGYAELRAVFQEKILTNPTLQAVPLVVQDKVIRAAVENYHALERMIEHEKPDVLFALHEINPWGKMLGYLSQVHRIPYFTLQEGLYYADLFYYRFHTDFSTACLVWGEDCRQILLRAGCSDDKIFPVGNTHLWAAKQEFTAPVRVARTRTELGVAPGKKIILLLMSHSFYTPFEAKIFLDWMKKRGDVVAVFKWHPVTSKEIVTRAMQNLQNEPNVFSIFGIDTYALIGASDVCITVGNSTTGLEALAFGKPLIEVRLPDQQYSFVEHGVAELAKGFESFGAKCAPFLDGQAAPDWQRRVDDYLAYNFAHRDEHTMERIMTLVEESLAERNRARQGILPLSQHEQWDFPVSVVLPVDTGEPDLLLATLEAISEQTPAQLYEIVIVNCSARSEVRSLLDGLSGDVQVIDGDPKWSYATACNAAARVARGKFLALLKPGMEPQQDWLVALLELAEEDGGADIVGGLTLNANGLIWHMGLAFDVNQTPFSIYRMLHPEFPGAQKQRNFRAMEFPFLVGRGLYCTLGGLAEEFDNRFEDVDFCLRGEEAKVRTLYTPASRMVLRSKSWTPDAERDLLNRIRFFSKWTGSLWQDDEIYLSQDALSHDVLSALYRDLASRVAQGAQQALKNETTVSAEGTLPTHHAP